MVTKMSENISRAELLRAAKPILFNQDMVRANIDKLKTATRRLVKFPKGYNPEWSGYVADGPVVYGSHNVPAVKAPYKPGDILYVRETWCSGYDGEKYFFRADKHTDREEKALLDYDAARWRPSIHMPKKAARIFLRITDVRAERLKDINGEQAYMEGVRVNVPPILLTYEKDPLALIPKGFEQWPKGKQDDWYQSTARAIYIAQCDLSNALIDKFKQVWNSTVAPDAMDTCGWDANPWVWVIEYERVEIDEENETDKR